ncbi:MAG: hypothetical protein AAB268_12365 [Elusimicrobiota bacterium]
MDIKSLILQSEDSLPTLAQHLSTATAATPSLPTITADASTYWKFGGSAVMGLAGMLYLGYGKKNGDVSKLIIGAALTLGSLFLF